MRAKGQNYERIAQRFLEKQGCELLDKNYRCKTGEIDLIVKHDNTLIFVEVKFRSTACHGSAEESVTLQKQRRIISAAKHYLTKHQCWSMNCRFDVIAITPDRTLFARHNINWLQGAFETHT